MYTTISIEQLGLDYAQPITPFINNEYVECHGEKIASINPANGKVLAEVVSATKEDVDKAVQAAKKASKAWRKIDVDERSRLLLKIAEGVEQHRKVLGAIDAIDGGKPFHTNALGDIDQVIEIFRYYAGLILSESGGVIPLRHDKFVYTIKEPYGVVGQIVPWNYPLGMAGWKMASALAAGNCIVIKPSEITPLSLLYFGQIAKDAGLPAGVLNIVPGYGKDTGAALVQHPDVDKIAFTGSTATGIHIQKMAAETLKAVTLECGGKSPMVVFADADLDKAVEWGAFGIFYNSGQVCTANSRIYVQDAIYDKFIEKFSAHAKEKWVLGDIFDENTTMGPLVSQQQYEKVTSYIKLGEETGLKKTVLCDTVPSGGYHVSPTIFSKVPQDSRLSKEEIFGPVVVIAPFSDYDDAIKKANDTCYGLAAMVFTENISVAHSYARDVKAGSLYINSSNDESVRVAFGGFKMSGVGRELGLAGLDAYLETKSVHVTL